MHSPMKGLKTTAYCAAKALLLLSASVPAIMVAQQAEAQQVSTAVRGTVTDAAGNPIANAEISVIDTRTGRATVASTDTLGRFAVSGLEAGGPYNVLVKSTGNSTQRIEGLFLSISQTANLNITVQPSQAIEEIVVTAAATVTSALAIGPSQSFNLETLESFPSITRDIRDIIRIDPRVSINERNSRSVSCLGGNNRFNSFTIDGVQSNDPFGLNASGFPARNNMPIPFDATREVSVEFAPYDVTYGQFTGCNINLVTKSGANEFHGSAFFEFNSKSLTGTKINGDTVITDPFRDKRWGAELGGPIVKDKLFLYVAYEEAQLTNTVNRGPVGGGFANEQGPTVDLVNQVQQILENTYGIQTLGIARSLPADNRRILTRLDWFINDDHRVAVTYSRLRENNGRSDDFGFGNNFAFKNNFENQGSEIETYSVRFFDQWSDNFSTQLWLSRADNTDIQDPLGGGEAQSGNPIPRIFVTEGDATLLSGPGQFRSANALDTTINQVVARGKYLANDHTITFGYELNQLDVFNLFAPNATGVIEFASLADFQAGIASDIFGNGSFTGDINDAAAKFNRAIHSIYAQDEWQVDEYLTLLFGLRYDFYTSGSQPRLSENFLARYGFPNTEVFDGLDVFLPRLGITYEAPWEFYGETTFRAGAGVFSGGDPTVWFSNAFSNTGKSIAPGSIQDPPCTDADRQVLDANGNFTGIPDCITQAQINAAINSDGRTDAVDPNFKPPSVVRGSFGLTHFFDFDGAAGGFFDDWRLDFDIIHDRRRNAPDFIDLTVTPIGFAPDGRLIFNAIDPLKPGCDALFRGPRLGFSGSTEEGGPCDAGRRDQDILLTNVKPGAKNGGTTAISVILNKEWDYTLFNRPASFDLTIGYAFTDAKVVNPSTSSTATSNFEEQALFNINDPQLAPSQFANKHNFTLAANFRHEFFRDLATRLSVLFRARSGRPFSYVFDDRSAGTFGDTDNEARQLFYVPTGPNDPRVDFSALSQEDIDNLFALIKSSGLDKFAGQIAPRNQFHDPWFKDLDLRFSQDVPTPWEGHHLQLFVDFDNVLNFFDSGSNLLRTKDRGDVAEGVPIVNASLTPDGKKFVYSNLSGRANIFEDDIFVDSSVWRVQLGIRYRF